MGVLIRFLDLNVFYFERIVAESDLIALKDWGRFILRNWCLIGRQNNHNLTS